jgi:hypothetical protein
MRRKAHRRQRRPRLHPVRKAGVARVTALDPLLASLETATADARLCNCPILHAVASSAQGRYGRRSMLVRAQQRAGPSGR